MPHIIEHLLLHPEDINDLERFLYRYDIDWYSEAEHIYFVYDEFLMPKNSIMKILNQNVTQKIIDYEYSIFEEEFWNRSYFMRLIDKICQNKYNADRSSKPVKYSIDEIKSYMNEFITNGKYIYFDNLHDIITDTNISYEKLLFENKYEDFDYEMVLLQWSKNHIFYKAINSVFDFLLHDFLANLWSSFDLLQKRFILWSYYRHPTHTFYDSKNLALRSIPDQMLNISNDFFDKYKAHYIKFIDNNEKEIINVKGILYTSQYAPKEEMIKYIQNLPFSYIQNLINKIEK